MTSRIRSRLAGLLGLCAGALVAQPAGAEPAPAARAVIPAGEAPAAMAPLFADLSAGSRTIAVPDASWLQLQLADVVLGPSGRLTVADAAGQSQSFGQAEIDAWGGLTAAFAGGTLTVTLEAGPDGAPVSARVADIVVGLPAVAPETVEASVPARLRSMIGADLRSFIPADVFDVPGEGPAPEAAPQTVPRDAVAQESICGTTDDRAAATDARVGRIMPVGCTGWLIDGGVLLTAGHCTGANMQTLEFNVPASAANGATNPPPVRDQYRIDAGSVVTQNTGVGNDWAVFRVLPNTETGMLPAGAQGATFQVSNTANPAQVRITGYGVDGPAPTFGAGGPRDATNQTLQTHNGALTGNAGNTLNYTTDTQGGNSGSPVISNGTATTVGIHTNGGCGADGGANAGTSFRNAALWAAVQAAQVPTGDVLWQHVGGQPHYWPIQRGVRQGGTNIGPVVGREWTLIGGGDVNGDGTEDLIWQHVSGQVHFWPMRNGVRQGGIDIATPVGPDWRLVGAGDVNGDGTDDLLWQHMFGQVHYWPMRGGQRQGGIDIATPVGRDWRMIGSGDFNGDGTDDILWQHMFGQVHYWPMRGGQRQGGIDIATPVGNDWRLIGAGDLNGDRTDDILWQHFTGQVHFWPIVNGQNQGGVNIGPPVGGDWRLVGVASVD